jgi:hypothetical protein
VVRLLDCVLVSGALGATLFTVFVMGGAAGEPIPAPRPAHSAGFDSVVVHVLGGCDRVRSATDAHFVITADGESQSTVLWRRGASPSADSKSRQRAGRRPIIVAVEPSPSPSPSSEGRHAALRELIARLAERYPGIETRVLTHGQLDGTPCGRGRID